MHKRPNILLITTDTQRCDTLRCMGNPHAVSPNIDRLASEGVLFEQAHPSCPVCMPARTSLMTGVHPQVHGCIENGFTPLDHFPHISEYLQEQGYHTIMLGKTHFGRVRGFDVDLSTVNTQEPFERDTECLENSLAQLEKAIDDRREPFFAFCSFVSPHGPENPKGEWETLYENVPLPEINYREGETESHPGALKRLLGLENGIVWDREEFERRRVRYYGLATYCDHIVGRLMDLLERKGVREDTVVIFSSDHGIQLMDHGFCDKHTWYDESWRVPFIISHPGTIPSGVRDGFVSWNDIAPTVLSIAGASASYMQGYDIYTPLSQGKQSPRSCAPGFLYKSAAVVTKSWKLEYYFEDGAGRLFDRDNDPQEQADLFNDESVAKTKERLLTGLLAWTADSNDVKGLGDRSVNGGGPISKLVVPLNRNNAGVASEERLNRVCEGLSAAEDTEENIVYEAKV